MAFAGCATGTKCVCTGSGFAVCYPGFGSSEGKVRRKVILSIVVAAFVLAAIGVYTSPYRSKIIGALPVPVRDAIRGRVHGFTIQRNVMIPMPDGVKIATNIYMPRGQEGAVRHRAGATALRQEPVRRGGVDRGRVLQSRLRRRGTGRSRHVPFRRRLYSEPAGGRGRLSDDGLDREAALVNGKVGTFGCSSLGEAQMFMARMRNPHHRALIAQGNGGAMGTAFNRYTFFGLYEGGIFNLASGFGWFLSHGGKHPGVEAPDIDRSKALWGLPSAGLVAKYRSDPTDFADFVSRAPADPYWRDLGYIADEDRFNTPGLQANAWQDQTVADTPAARRAHA